MAVTEPCYTQRERVKSALDFQETARNDLLVDDSIQAASRLIDGAGLKGGGLLHRVFYPTLRTCYFDWPNYQRAWPWILYLNATELAAAPTDPAAVKAGNGTVTIPLAACRFEPVNSGPPYTSLELDRSSTSVFGGGSTPQRDISITGLYGYSADTAPAGTLAAAVTDTTGTSVVCSNSAVVGVGDNVLVDTERMLVTDKAWSTTGQSQQGSGCTQADVTDDLLTVTDGSKYAAGEVLQLDGERLLITGVAGNLLTVKRQWDGTVLAAHAGATVYAPRTLIVTRGALGTTAATHTNSTAILRHVVPTGVAELALAEAINIVISKTSGWARTIGSGDNVRNATGAGLADLRKSVYATYGRQGRSRTI
jgi:hypothetical protein